MKSAKTKYIFFVILVILPDLLFADTKQSAQRVSINQPALSKSNINFFIKGGFIEIDRIKIIYWDNVLSNYKPLQEGQFQELSPTKLKNEVQFSIPDKSSTGYIVLTKKKTNYPYELKYFVEPRDSIVLQPMFDFMSFSGRGAEKYNCINKINQAFYECNNEWNEKYYNVQPLRKNIEASIQRYDYIFEKQMQILNSYKKDITLNSYEIIRLNLIGLRRKLQQELVERMLALYNAAEKEVVMEIYNTMKLQFKKEELENSIIVQTDEYINSIVNNLRNDRRIMNSKNEFARINDEFTGEVRDKILLNLFIDYYEIIPNVDDLLTQAFKTVKTPFCRIILTDLSNNLSKGTKAYDFMLEDMNGKKVMLSDFFGKTVFIDFWFTGCGGCAAYYKNTIHPTEQQLSKDTTVVFITISLDKNKEVWKGSVKSGKYTNLNAVNLYTEGKGSEHIVAQKYKIQDCPRPVLIDKFGKIVTVTKTDMNSPQQLFSQIANAFPLPRVLQKKAHF